MGKRLINVDEVEEIIPVLVGKLLENNLITEKQADQIICAIFNDNCLGEYGEGDVHQDVETSTVGYFIEEDDKAIVLASSIYGINIPDSLCKDCMVIPKAYIKDITSIGTELVAQLLYFLQQRNYITEEQMNDACNEILKSN